MFQDTYDAFRGGMLMNKRCTDSSCRRTFSTLNADGKCPHCGKVFQVDDTHVICSFLSIYMDRDGEMGPCNLRTSIHLHGRW